MLAEHGGHAVAVFACLLLGMVSGAMPCCARRIACSGTDRWTWSCIRDTKDGIIFVSVGVLVSVLTVLPTVKSRERRWFVLKRPRSDINGESESEVTVTSKLHAHRGIGIEKVKDW